MTVKELAAFTGRDKSTIGRWVAKCNLREIKEKLRISSSVSPADYSLEEVEKILLSGSLSKDAVNILMNNARQGITLPEPKDSTLSKRDIDIIAGIISKVFENLNSRMITIEKHYEERKELLPPPQISLRKMIAREVNDFCFRTGQDQRASYSELYREFNYRHNVNVQLRAKNRGVRPIDLIEQDNMLPQLAAVAAELFAPGMLI